MFVCLFFFWEGGPVAPSHMTLSDLEGQSQGHREQGLEALYLVQEPS